MEELKNPLLKKDGTVDGRCKRDQSTRPKKEVDWELVDELLLAGCIGTEIAPWFNMHPTTFYHKVEDHYGMSFTAYAQQKAEEGISILRKVQYDKAIGKSETGDNTLLIWLGKVRCNQRENNKVEVNQLNLAELKKALAEGDVSQT